MIRTKCRDIERERELHYNEIREIQRPISGGVRSSRKCTRLLQIPPDRASPVTGKKEGNSAASAATKRDQIERGERALWKKKYQ